MATACTLFSCEMATCCQWNSRQYKFQSHQENKVHTVVLANNWFTAVGRLKGGERAPTSPIFLQINNEKYKFSVKIFLY